MRRSRALHLREAAVHAFALGFPFNVYLTGTWELARVCPRIGTQQVLKYLRDYLALSDVPLFAIWVLERGNVGVNAHLLLHVPSGPLLDRFEKVLCRRWFARISGRKYRKRLVTRNRIVGSERPWALPESGGAFDEFDSSFEAPLAVATERDVYLSNLWRVLSYFPAQNS